MESCRHIKGETKINIRTNRYNGLLGKLSFARLWLAAERRGCKYPDRVSVRAIRGAIQVEENSVDALNRAVPKLLEAILVQNDLAYDDLISLLFTATPDLTAEFPAAAARILPIGEVPLICAAEIDVPGALPRVVRVLVHAEISKPRNELRHVYLDGAEVLRKDLAQ